MGEIFVKSVTSDYIGVELDNIGFDSSYLNHAVEKNTSKTLKIFNLRPQEASILKQSALVLGFDAAVNRGVIDCSVEYSDAVLTGSVVQFKRLCVALEKQPFKMKQVAAKITKSFDLPSPITFRDKIFDWSRPYIAGILNITPDSFSDGGKYFEIETALAQFKKLADAGADIIDIGAESTRPGHTAVSSDEEIERLRIILGEIVNLNKDYAIPLSLDTRNMKTAAFGVNLGIDIINDIGFAEYDPQMVDFINTNNIPYVLMHNKSAKSIVVDEVYEELLSKSQMFTAPLIIDPGIGFEKKIQQDYELISRISEFKSLGMPVLCGHSRKKFLHKSFDLTPNELDIATLAVSSALICEGVNILRVHDVASHKLVANVMQKIR